MLVHMTLFSLQPVYNPANDAQVGVPAPTIKVSSMGKSGLIMEWFIDNREESEYEVQQYIVNIVGRDFSARDINSHIRYLILNVLSSLSLISLSLYLSCRLSLSPLSLSLSTLSVCLCLSLSPSLFLSLIK